MTNPDRNPELHTQKILCFLLSFLSDLSSVAKYMEALILKLQAAFKISSATQLE